MGYNEDMPSSLVTGVVLREQASRVKVLMEPRAEPYSIEIAGIEPVRGKRSVFARFRDLLLAPSTA